MLHVEKNISGVGFPKNKSLQKYGVIVAKEWILFCQHIVNDIV